MAKDTRRREISERNDFITGILLGALVIGWLLYDGIRRIADLVGVPGTVTVTTRVPEFRADVPIGDAADAVVGPFFRNMGLNGVFAALGGDFDGQWTLLADSSPLFIAAIAAGVAAIVFRRGYALQKDTEGLV